MRRFTCAVISMLAVACTRDIAVPPLQPASVSGRVVTEEAGTGRRLPAPGARIEVVGSGLATLADDGGRFQLASLPPAPRQVLVQWSSTTSGAFDRQRVLSGGVLDGAGAIDLGDVEVLQNGQIRGRALLAQVDPQAPDQVGTFVFVEKTPLAQVTAQGGSFLITNVPPGVISLAFSRPGRAVATVDAVDVPGGATLTLSNVYLGVNDGGSGPGGMSGTVVEPDGSAANGASVTATVEATPGAVGKSTTTAVDGSWQLGGLPPGPYLVRFQDTAARAQAQLGGVLVLSGGNADVGKITLSTTPLAPPPGQAPTPPPVAVIGPDQIVAPGGPVRLDGSGSQGEQLLYSWSQLSGPAVALAPNDSSTAQATSFFAPDAGTLWFSLVVQDDLGQQSLPATTHVTVNAPPLAVLTASALAVPPGATLTLSADGSTDVEPTDVLTFGAPVQTPAGGTLAMVAGTPGQWTFSSTAEGSFTFQVPVSDGYSTSISNPVTVTFSNTHHAPVARASVVNTTRPGQPIQAGNDVGLDGTASIDPDGRPLTYQWTAIGGAPAPFCLGGDGGCSFAHVIAPAASGTYDYSLAVTDDYSPPLQSVTTVAFTVNVPVATVVSTTPVNGATGVNPGGAVQVVFDRPLNAANVAANPRSAMSGAAPVAGSTTYVNASGYGTVTWIPRYGMPPNASVTVTFPAFQDANGNTTASVTLTFMTHAAQWVDRTPPDPGLTASYPGAPDGGADFGPTPSAPALLGTSSGTYLYWLQFDKSSNGSHHVGRFDQASSAWVPVSLPPPWSNPAYGASQINWASAQDYFFVDKSVRAYLGSDPAGNPTLAYDNGTANVGGNVYYGSFLSSYPSNLNNIPLDGFTLGNDGTTSWMAFRGCSSNVNPNANFLFLWSMDGSSKTLLGPGVTNPSCQVPANLDWGMGAAAFAQGSNTFYLAYAYAQQADGGGYVENLFQRPATVTTFSDAGVVSGLGLFDGGILNGAPVNGNSVSLLASTPKGPLLAFLEFPANDPTQSRIRVMRYDEVGRAMIDPLFDVVAASSSSIVQVALPDGTSWTQPVSPALAASGTVPYLAFEATHVPGGEKQLFVVHADPISHQWVLDADSIANADGALNKHAGCRPTQPAIAIINGAPVVAWDEVCPIPLQSDSDNFLVVKRLE